MKKRLKSKAFKILTLVVCLVMTVLASGINTFAAASTQTTSVNCPLGLCTRKLLISGPYGNADDVVDSSIPYLGGRTYENIYSNDYEGAAWYMAESHMYIVYCTRYSHDTASILNHTMTIIFPRHGYTVTGYEPFNSFYHYTDSVCDHNETSSDSSSSYALTQGLGGENARLSTAEIKSLMTAYNTGCGKPKRTTERHDWIYGAWVSEDGTQHQRTKTCSLCGFSTVETEDHTLEYGTKTPVDGNSHIYTRTCTVCGATDTVTQGHTFTYSDWTDYVQSTQDQLDRNAPDSIKYHVRTKICSDCGYTAYEYEEHNHVRDYEGYIDNGASNSYFGHYYTVHCTVCGHGIIYYQRHKLNENDKVYTDISDTQHNVYQACADNCGYENRYDENHTFTTTCEPISETQHKITQTCICGHTVITCGDHHDDDSDCYCDDCGYLMTRFSVTVPAALSLVTDKDGKVYTPTNAAITNHSTAAVKVTDMMLTAQNGWTVVPYSTDMANEKVDAKKIGLKLRDSESNVGDSMPVTGNWTVPKDGSLPLTYTAVVSAASQPVTGEHVLDVTFVIDWGD